MKFIEHKFAYLAYDPFILSYHLDRFGDREPSESGYITFFISHVITSFVVWLCGWDSFILSYQMAKSEGHRYFECRDTTFFICHETTCCCFPFIPSHHPAKFEGHRPYERGDNGAYNMSFNSSSNSNAEVPMSRFINGRCNTVEIIWMTVILRLQ